MQYIRSYTILTICSFGVGFCHVYRSFIAGAVLVIVWRQRLPSFNSFIVGVIFHVVCLGVSPRKLSARVIKSKAANFIPQLKHIAAFYSMYCLGWIHNTSSRRLDSPTIWSPARPVIMVMRYTGVLRTESISDYINRSCRGQKLAFSTLASDASEFALYFR